MKKIKLQSFEEWGKKKLKDLEFAKACEEPDDDPFIEISYRLLKLMEKHHLTRSGLARKIHASVPEIKNLMNPCNKKHPLKLLDKIAHAFDKKLQIRFI